MSPGSKPWMNHVRERTSGALGPKAPARTKVPGAEEEIIRLHGVARTTLVNKTPPVVKHQNSLGTESSNLGKRVARHPGK